MYQHAKIFKYKKQKIVLLLDKVLLSLDDLKQGEFVFAKIKDNHINKTLYFVTNYTDYTKFKKDYKAILCGFWHTLFSANQINLSGNSEINIKTEEFVYGVFFDGDVISNTFMLIAQAPDDGLLIDNELITGFSQIISVADKLKKQNKHKKIVIGILAIIWLIVGGVSYYLYQDKVISKLDIIKKISNVKNKTLLINTQIITIKKDVYEINNVAYIQIQKILFLKFKGINITGEVVIDKNILVDSSTDINVLNSFAKDNDFKIIEGVEVLPKISWSYE